MVAEAPNPGGALLRIAESYVKVDCEDAEIFMSPPAIITPLRTIDQGMVSAPDTYTRPLISAG